jgi:hypothetical protein
LGHDGHLGKPVGESGPDRGVGSGRSEITSQASPSPVAKMRVRVRRQDRAQRALRRTSGRRAPDRLGSGAQADREIGPGRDPPGALPVASHWKPAAPRTCHTSRFSPRSSATRSLSLSRLNLRLPLGVNRLCNSGQRGTSSIDVVCGESVIVSPGLSVARPGRWFAPPVRAPKARLFAIWRKGRQKGMPRLLRGWLRASDAACLSRGSGRPVRERTRPASREPAARHAGLGRLAVSWPPARERDRRAA